MDGQNFEEKICAHWKSFQNFAPKQFVRKKYLQKVSKLEPILQFFSLVHANVFHETPPPPPFEKQFKFSIHHFITEVGQI